MIKDRRLALLAAAAVLLLLAVAAYLRRGSGPSTPTSAATTASAATIAPTAAPRAGPSASPEARRARDAMRAQILAALQRRDAGAPPPSVAKNQASPAPPAPAAGADDSAVHGKYETSYIQENFREQIFPLLRGCYEAALERNPKLAGKLVFSFRIVGDPSVGGVVEDSDFADESELRDAEMETCTRESVMTLTFDKPPTGGGYVSVKYPVDFAPGDDDEADAGDAGNR